MTSNAPLPPASGTRTNPITMSDKKGGESSSNSRKGSKKQKKNLGPKLIAIKSLVESQPTTDLQSKLVYRSARALHIPQPMRIPFFAHLHYELKTISHHYQYCPLPLLIHEPSIESASSYQCH
jgi:hypothetical protein